MPIDNARAAMKAICPHVYQQGSMSRNQDYPVEFLTYWPSETRDHKHYDNTASGCVWTLDVNCYSSAPSGPYSTLQLVIQKLREAGWIISGKGHAVASDHNTHTGWGITAVFIET